MPEPRIFRLEALAEGMAADNRFTVDSVRQAQFAALSGDFNPLHTNADFARARGHNGPVVYGALLLAELSRLIGMDLPGRDAMWTDLDMQFHTPLYLDEEATIRAEITHISLATRAVQLRVQVHADTRLVARGRASVVLDDGD